ncbi:death domain-associated protein 6 [Clarias gariepinus]|uniref:death domain-associated protein 6 n=1 Tax=Clarias gariepinus TaxID=13013 RepID=UPI00234D552E|nr:death domain-associated protein 6 [Clarias gariepinus]
MMAAVSKVTESIVILDDDDDGEKPSPSSFPSSCHPQSADTPRVTHVPESPFASASKKVHILKVENEKLFSEFVDHCVKHAQEHPEVVPFLKSKYAKAFPDFLTSVEFRNAVGRCLTKAQAQTSKTFVYINELCTILKKHSSKRKSNIQPVKPPNGDEIANANVKNESARGNTGAGEEEKKTKRASRKQIAHLENLLKVYSDEIKRLQERELSLEELEKEDSCYIQEHKLKRRMMKIYDKLCELKNCSTHTGRVMEQRIHYSGTRYPEINKKIERFINRPEVHENPPDYTDILQVVKRANKRNQLMLSRKQEAQIAQEAFCETGSKLQERRHLDMVYNFGSHLTDLYKPTSDPAINDSSLERKLRSNREVALGSLEEVINKYALKQDDAEEEDRRKRLEKDKAKKEDGQQASVKAERSDKSEVTNQAEEEKKEKQEGEEEKEEKDEEDEEEEDAEEDEEEDEEDDEESSDPDIEEEIKASEAQDGPDDEDNEEERLSASDDAVQPGSNGSCPSVKSPDCGDESADDVPQSDIRTSGSISTEKYPENKHSPDSPSSSHGHGESGVRNPRTGEADVLLDSNSIGEATGIPFAIEDCVSIPVMMSAKHPEATSKMSNSKKRKRESKRNHTIVHNGNAGESDVSNSDVSRDVKMACSPVLVDSTRADTPTQDLVSSSRSTPPPKKHKVNVATQCDPDEVIVLSDSD